MRKNIGHHIYDTDTAEVIARTKSDIGERGDLDYIDITLYRTKKGLLFTHNANARFADRLHVYCGIDEIQPVNNYWKNLEMDGEEWWTAEAEHRHYYKGQEFISYDYYDFIIQRKEK